METMSNTIKIVRYKSQPIPSSGIFGNLYFNDVKIGVTCEQPWRDNKKRISCIPEGSYKLVAHNSAKYGQVVAFVNHDLDVYHNEYDMSDEKRETEGGRSVCLIHAANWPRELQGCVAVGHKVIDYGMPNGWGITESRKTLSKLRTLWGDRKGLFAEISWEK